MMENTETKSKKYKDRFIDIVITQLVTVALILISVLVIKYFFKTTYTELKDWYKDNICVDTDIDEVLKADGDIYEV